MSLRKWLWDFTKGVTAGVTAGVWSRNEARMSPTLMKHQGSWWITSFFSGRGLWLISIMILLYSLLIVHVTPGDVYGESICRCGIKLTERKLYDFVFDLQKIAMTIVIRETLKCFLNWIFFVWVKACQTGWWLKSSFRPRSLIHSVVFLTCFPQAHISVDSLLGQSHTQPRHSWMCHSCLKWSPWKSIHL